MRIKGGITNLYVAVIELYGAHDAKHAIAMAVEDGVLLPLEAKALLVWHDAHPVKATKAHRRLTA